MTEIDQRPAALVTGAATRLGLAFARALAMQGFDIALHYHHSKSEAEAAIDEITALGVHCQGFQCDLAGEGVNTLVDEVVERFPALQLLINCASAYTAAKIAETTPALLKQQFEVNFFAPFLLSGRFASVVQRGSIINIIDNKIAFQQNNYAAYLLSKKALAELTTLSAVEFAPNIRVNGIAPGVVLPGSNRTEDYIAWRVQGIPAGRQGHVSELVAAMNYLLQNEFVIGQVLYVDGGESINQRGLNAEDYVPGSGS